MFSATLTGPRLELYKVGAGERDSPKNEGSRRGSAHGQTVLAAGGEVEVKRDGLTLQATLRPRTAKNRAAGEGSPEGGEKGEEEQRPEQQPLLVVQLNPHPPEDKKRGVEEAQSSSTDGKTEGHAAEAPKAPSPKQLSPQPDQNRPTPPPDKQRASPTHTGHADDQMTKSRPKEQLQREATRDEPPSNKAGGSAKAAEANKRPAARDAESSRGRTRTRSARSTATAGGAGQSRSRNPSARSRSAASSRAQTPGRRPDSAVSCESDTSHRPVTPLTGRSLRALSLSLFAILFCINSVMEC